LAWPPFAIARHSRCRLTAWVFRLSALLLLCCTLTLAATPPPAAWVPIRWTGGPLELAWRLQTKRPPADPTIRDVLAHWYEPATLGLLENSNANCLLVTFSAPAEAAVAVQQQELVKTYAEAAHKVGLAVLGLVYAPGDAPRIAADAVHAGLDGLVLDGDFKPGFASTLRNAATALPVIEIVKEAAAVRWNSALTISAVAGVPPSAHNLADMGIRGTPSSQPWIQSNLWLVRSLRLVMPSRPVWVSSQLENPSAQDYARAVADASAAGGRWIISLDDTLRAKLRSRDPAALATWRQLNSYLKYAETQGVSLSPTAYGNVGIVVDPANAGSSDEYLSLMTRRQVPYRLVPRSELNAASIAKLRALVVIDLDPPSAAESKLLQQFAEDGGTVIAGPSWGNAPANEPFAELPAGKGRVVVYKDPDPESVAKDLKELLEDSDLGVVPFNVPSVITLVAGGGTEQPLQVQLVNYFDHPVEAITLRVAGKYKSARMETPEDAPVNLPVRDGEGSTEVTIAKLLLWGTVSMQ